MASTYTRIDDLEGQESTRRSSKKFVLGGALALFALMLVGVAVVSTVTVLRTDSSAGTQQAMLAMNSDNNGDDGAAASELKRMAEYMTSAMDTSADPCDDFYQYACGGWIKDTPLPPEKARLVRSFDGVSKDNEKVLREILEDPAGSWPIIGVFHKSCTSLDNDAELSASALALFKEYIVDKVVALATTPNTILAVAGHLHRLGASPLFSFGTETDAKDPTHVLTQLSQGGLVLPTIELYTTDCDESLAIREVYTKYIVKVLKSLQPNLSDADAAKRAANIIAFETKLAKNSWAPAKLRDPQATYNVMSFEELQAFTTGLDWSGFFAGANTKYGSSEVAKDAPTPARVNVAVKSFFTALEDVLASADPAVAQDYFTVASASAFNVAMPKDIREAHFVLFGKAIGGMQQDVDRSKACIDATDAAVGELLGRYFVQQKFSPKAKTIALEMVEAIEDAFDRGLPGVEWLDDTTRDAARKKLKMVTNKIGFPDNWESYSGLLVTEHAMTNLFTTNEFSFEKKTLAKMDAPVDRSAWEMTPATVNAYYNPGGNEMVFPSGILQPPFFHETWPKVLNFGSIGAVIGHELTHGFDDQGSQYDGEGKLTEWWSKDIVAKFNEQTSCVRDLYSTYCVKTEDGSDMCLDGANTLGENIADCGGVRKSFSAYTKWLADNEDKEKPFLPDLDLKQTFFVQYAQTWCGKSSIAQDRLRIATDPHSLSKFRVMGPLSNFDEFGKAFNCPLGSTMNPEKKCSVW